MESGFMKAGEPYGLGEGTFKNMVFDVEYTMGASALNDWIIEPPTLEEIIDDVKAGREIREYSGMPNLKTNTITYREFAA